MFQIVLMVTTVELSETVPMPALLASLTGREGDIILGFREKLEGTKKREVVRQTSRGGERVAKREQTDLDLTGSPLGAGFDVDQEWNLSSSELVGDEGEGRIVSGPVYRGVGVAQARGG